jgi:hypothetical protein
MINEIRTFVYSFTGVRNIGTFIFNTGAALLGFILAKFKIIVLNNEDIFLSITVVVIADAFFGMWANIKDFQTKKGLKIFWYLGGYWTLTAMVLLIEKSHPAAFWLSETIVMPILVFQIISILKNLSLIGLLPKSLATELLEKIDQHKNKDKA